MFYTKKNKTICSNPEDNWANRAMKETDARKANVPQDLLFTVQVHPPASHLHQLKHQDQRLRPAQVQLHKIEHIQRYKNRRTNDQSTKKVYKCQHTRSFYSASLCNHKLFLIAQNYDECEQNV